jgi:hypothetical protein
VRAGGFLPYSVTPSSSPSRIPRIKQAPGFVAGHWVRLDEATGTAMIVFESEEAAQAAAERIRTNPPAGDAVTINSIEIGEVVGHA